VPKGFQAPQISLPDCQFHHIGYATTALNREREFFELLGYKQEEEAFTDPIQGVAGCFLQGAGPRIELLENIPGAVTLTPWLNAGVKIYHIAYLVGDLESAVNWARNQRAKITVMPVPAVAFGGRRISFAMCRNGMLLEFIETKDSKTP
jgi:methylmalonyl-CoA/ethylmalonyl-CoA epimerase